MASRGSLPRQALLIKIKGNVWVRGVKQMCLAWRVNKNFERKYFITPPST